MAQHGRRVSEPQQPPNLDARKAVCLLSVARQREGIERTADGQKSRWTDRQATLNRWTDRQATLNPAPWRLNRADRQAT